MPRMIYISLGLVLIICGSIFLVAGQRKHWREIRNGSIVLLGVGIFMFAAALVAFAGRA